MVVQSLLKTSKMHGGPVTFMIHWTSGKFLGISRPVQSCGFFSNTGQKKIITCEVKVTTLSVRPSHNGIWIVALPFEVLPIGSHQLLNVLNNQVNCHCNSQETNTQQFNSAWEKTAIAPECTVNICGEPFLKHHFQQTCVGCLSSATNPICLLSPQKCSGPDSVTECYMKEQKLLISHKCVSGPYSVSEYTHARTKIAVLHESISGLQNKNGWFHTSAVGLILFQSKRMKEQRLWICTLGLILFQSKHRKEQNLLFQVL